MLSALAKGGSPFIPRPILLRTPPPPPPPPLVLIAPPPPPHFSVESPDTIPFDVLANEDVRLNLHDAMQQAFNFLMMNQPSPLAEENAFRPQYSWTEGFQFVTVDSESAFRLYRGSLRAIKWNCGELSSQYINETLRWLYTYSVRLKAVTHGFRFVTSIIQNLALDYQISQARIDPTDPAFPYPPGLLYPPPPDSYFSNYLHPEAKARRPDPPPLFTSFNPEAARPGHDHPPIRFWSNLQPIFWSNLSPDARETGLRLAQAADPSQGCRETFRSLINTREPFLSALYPIEMLEEKTLRYQLVMEHRCALSIIDTQTNDVVWSSGAFQIINKSCKAQLLMNGNLVVSAIDTGEIFWHTDTAVENDEVGETYTLTLLSTGQLMLENPPKKSSLWISH
ncbi:hypothetical protein GOP47_0011750 [Adiantum capillus-veneris]|uniref:Bulb-type lectin domain-containing protein n=1 Tax=Adiantum capillus-veneris TaxID=13818 RepID=A0A9D4UUR4_ADICA|nr:hypothetical protein GOP47_0011750 [Adiantum capillus-veneris]